MNNELKNVVGITETIYYEGKPDFKCFIFESIFNPMLIFALIWAVIDFSIIGTFIAIGDDSLQSFIFPFFAIHLMPVWLYIGGVLTSVFRYKNTYYIVTDQAIYVSSGVLSKKITTKPFYEVSHVDLHRGVFDQWFKVGDIIVTTNQLNQNGSVPSANINSISNYEEVYQIVKKYQKDMYTDAMYPNDKRPKENHGYNTEYKG